MARTARVTLRLSPREVWAIKQYADSRHLPQSVALRTLIGLGVREARHGTQAEDNKNRQLSANRRS